MVGLHYLKALYDESDESVVWVETPTGNTSVEKKHFSTNCPVTNELAKMAAASRRRRSEKLLGCCELQ